MRGVYAVNNFPHYSAHSRIIAFSAFFGIFRVSLHDFRILFHLRRPHNPPPSQEKCPPYFPPPRSRFLKGVCVQLLSVCVPSSHDDDDVPLMMMMMMMCFHTMCFHTMMMMMMMCLLHTSSVCVPSFLESIFPSTTMGLYILLYNEVSIETLRSLNILVPPVTRVCYATSEEEGEGSPQHAQLQSSTVVHNDRSSVGDVPSAFSRVEFQDGIFSQFSPFAGGVKFCA